MSYEDQELTFGQKIFSMFLATFSIFLFPIVIYNWIKELRGEH